MTTSVSSTQAAAKLDRPKSTKALLITVGLHTLRALAIFELADYFTGDSPASGFIPSLGDSSIGLTAPIIVFLLWTKQGPAVWLAALVFNVLGTWDNVTAQIQFAVVEENPAGSIVFLPMNLVLALHVINFYLLSRLDVRRYYRVPSQSAGSRG